MEAYIVDWLNLLSRWLHFVAGIAWIGSSFYFIWLDNHLQAPQSSSDEQQGIAGDLWSVHGGGFYHAKKYLVAPDALPETLHWFKWEAYTTWLSGMFLLILVYWYGAEMYLIDPAVMALSQQNAIAIAAVFIVGGWLLYDGLCRTSLRHNDKLFGVALLIFVSLLAWSLCQLFSGRGAYIHFGVVLGTIMVANVFFVIIPGQKRMVAACGQGEAPNPEDSIRAKQRSVHNTYFTLPVLFVMTSNHFAMSYANEYNWAILVAVAGAGALVRVYFVARHKGPASPLPVVVALILLLAVSLAMAPKSRGATAASVVRFADVKRVIQQRCSTCHSASPTHPAFPAAPAGVMFDSETQILAEALRIHQQTVVTRVMPIGNLTSISDNERQIIDRWYLAGAKGSGQ